MVVIRLIQKQTRLLLTQPMTISSPLKDSKALFFIFNFLIISEFSLVLLYLPVFFILIHYFQCIFLSEHSEHAEHLIKKKILFPCGNTRDVLVKFYITYIITSMVFLSQLGYLLSILII